MRDPVATPEEQSARHAAAAEPTAEHIVHAAFQARFVEIESIAAGDGLRDLAQDLERAVEAAMDMEDEGLEAAAVVTQVEAVARAIHGRGCRITLQLLEREVTGVIGRMTLPGVLLGIVPR